MPFLSTAGAPSISAGIHTSPSSPSGIPHKKSNHHDGKNTGNRRRTGLLEQQAVQYPPFPQEVGTKAYFDEVEARKYFVEPHIVPFADFPRWKGKKVLEIGCGIGTDTVNFARAGALVTAVDLSSESLALTKKRPRPLALTDIRFYCANAEKLTATVPVETYDLVYSFGVIHHTPHPPAVIREIRHYMGPASTFKMMVYNRHSWKVLWILLSYGKGAFWKLDHLIAQKFGGPDRLPRNLYLHGKDSPGTLTGFFRNRLPHRSYLPLQDFRYVNYRYEKAWYFRGIPSRLFRWMESRWWLASHVDGQLAPVIH